MFTLQVTLVCSTGEYRPISALVKVENEEDYNKNPQKYQKRGIANICAQRHTSWWQLQRLGYTKMKVRNFTKLLQKEV